jgi:hypothetical protein
LFLPRQHWLGQCWFLNGAFVQWRGNSTTHLHQHVVGQAVHEHA